MEVAKILFFYFQLFLLFFYSYWLFISFFGFGKVSRIRGKPPQKRFLILIPAHNEERVIGSLIENLLNMEYPRELFDIYVIADNCSDQTADISRIKGSLVLEHTYLPGEPKGKPYAIRYALDVLDIDIYNAVCVFDADNLVTLNYLQQMNNHLISGERLIQCYLDSKNPTDNWITLCYATSYYYMNRSWQLAKYRLGLGNAVGGTGFCVERELLQEVGWTAKSLTEDLEFTMQCLRKGVCAAWCHHARVYDEKPTDFIASCIQRLRWARGHWDVCFKFAPKLLWQSIRKGDIQAFDGFLYLINPGKIVLGTLFGMMAVFEFFLDIPWLSVILPWYIWIFMLTFAFIYVAYSIFVDAAQRIGKAKALISLIIFNYTYVPLFIWALFTTNNKTWKRTDHTRNIASEEINLKV